MTEIRSAVLQLGIDTTGARRGKEEFAQAGEAVKKTARDAATEVKGLEANAESASKATASLSSYIKGLAASFVALYGASHVIGLLRDYDSGLIGLGKTAGIAGSELDALGDKFIGLSTRMPASTKALLDTAAVAAQLGVEGADNIVRFTEVITKLGTATNLKGEEGATALARILNVTGEGTQGVERLGSVIAKMDMAAAATASEIAHIATELAKATVIFKTSSTDAVGLAAGMASMGMQAELASSSTGRLMRTMDAAARGDVKLMGEFLKITGGSAEDFKKAFNASAVDATMNFVKALGQFKAAGGDVSAVLESLNLSGEHNAKVIPVLAERYQLMADSLKTAREEAVSMNALNDNFEKYSVSINSKLSVLGNTIDAIMLKTRSANSTIVVTLGYVTDVIGLLGGVKDNADKASTAVQTGAIAVEALSAAATVFVAIKFGPMLFDAAKGAIALTASSTALATTLSVLGLAIATVGVAFAAWELGKWAYENTEIIQDFTAGTVNFFNEMWSNIKYGYDVGIAYVLDSLTNGVAGIRTIAAGAISAYASVLSAIPGQGDNAFKAQQSAANLVSDRPELRKIDSYHIALEVQNAVQTQIEALQTRPETAALGTDLANSIIAKYSEAWSQLSSRSDQEGGVASSKVIAGLLGGVDELAARGGERAQEAAYQIRKAFAQALAESDPNSLGLKVMLAGVEKQVRDYENTLFAKQQATDILTDRSNGGLNSGGGEGYLATFKKDLIEVKNWLLGIDDAATAAGAAGQDAGNKAADAAKAATDAVQVQITTVHELTEAQKKAASAASEIFEAIRRSTAEYQRFNKDGVEAARSAANLDEKLRNAGLDFKGSDQASFDVEKFVADKRAGGMSDQQIRDSLQGLLAIEQQAEKTARKVNEVAESIGNAFGAQFEKMIFEGASWRDALEGFANDVLRAIFKAMVTDRLVEGVTSIAGNIMTSLMSSTAYANGGVFSGGHELHPMARGDIISAPTYRPMANGKTALMGESGIEALFPVVRGSDGRLAIEGKGGGGGVVNQQYINVITRESSDLRPTRRQMQSQIDNVTRGLRQ